MSSGSLGGFGAPATPGSGGNVGEYGSRPPVNGGRFDFDDGGTYCGGWEDGKAHGHGVCTGPKGQGEYSGSWHFGFEVSGVYTWPSGSTFEGQWQNGKRHGLGTEYRGRWTYRGEWTQGFKGRYGVRQATSSNAKYEGTWANGLQDGYGSETYADGGTYQGQWLRGLRHGYGVRTSAPFGMASHFKPKAPLGSMASLKSESAADPTSERDRRMDDVRGGFVLKSRSDEPPARRSSLVEKSTNIKDSILKGLKLRKQRSTGDLDKKGNPTKIRSTGSSSSWMSNDSAQSAVTSGSHHTDSNASFVVEDEHMDTNVTETYMGEWKNDKRSGFGISERSDGLKYEGEWYNNKKYGYGVTTFKDGSREEGKYKNNVLITSQKKKHLFLMRSAKFRERIDAAVNAAQRASKIALQKADIAISRTATARSKGEQADIAATHAREDSDIARVTAKQFAPDFHQPGTETIAKSRAHLQQQQQRVDLANKIGGYRGKDDRNQVTSPSGVLAGDPSLYDGPPQSFHPSIHMSSSSSVPPSASLAQYSNYPDPQGTSNIPDRFDRNSLINQPIDTHPESSQYSQQFQQQQQSQYGLNRAPYMNNTRQGSVEPMPSSSSASYNYNNAVPGGRRPYSQHLLDNQVGAGDSNKDSMLMGNSIGHGGGVGVGASQYGASSYSANSSTGAGNSNPLRNSMMMDSSMQQQHQQQPYGTTNMNAMMDATGEHDMMNQRIGRDPVRRAHVPRPNNPNPSSYNYQQAMSDHFDHYNRAPSLSRDTSMDRFHSRGRSATRARTPEVGPNPHSRASSRQRTPFMESQNAMGGGRAPSNVNIDNLIDPSLMRTRGETPGRTSGMESPTVGPGASESGSVFGGGPIDEMVLRQKGLGQEIPPLPYTPRRTESLFLKTNTPLLSGGAGGVGIGTPSKLPGPTGGGPIKRKKSLPDANSLPTAVQGMTREEVSYLGSARRQEVRRQQDEAERLRANPFLYLLNPNIRNWFSRQRLIVLVFFINVSLAIMFLQLLT